MQKKINIAFGVAVIFFVVLYFFQEKGEKTAYVNTIKLYNGFTYKVELEEEIIEKQKSRKWVLDSLKIGLQNLANIIDAGKKEKKQEKINEFEALRSKYLLTQQNFEEDNQVEVEKYTNQIWEQLNQYVGDYGESNGFEYIYGADGEGKMMYAKKENDLTEELIGYVNLRYSGGEK